MNSTQIEYTKKSTKEGQSHILPTHAECNYQNWRNFQRTLHQFLNFLSPSVYANLITGCIKNQGQRQSQNPVGEQFFFSSLSFLENSLIPFDRRVGRSELGIDEGYKISRFPIF